MNGFRTLALASFVLAAGPSAAQFGIVPLSPDLVPIPSRIATGTVSVRNVGSAPSAASIVTVQCQKQGGGGCPEHPAMAAFRNPGYPNRLLVAVPALPAGQVYNFALDFWGELVWPAGSYNFLLQADAALTVPETNEANNFAGHVVVKP